MLHLDRTFKCLKYEDNLTRDWREKFCSLSDAEKSEAKSFIAQNKFSDDDISCITSENIRDVLKFYQIKRN